MTGHTPAQPPPESHDGGPAQESAGFRWFPIRALGPRHRPRILTHLLQLGDSDRYLRFGLAANDSHIARYVDQLDFDRDEVFGVFDRRLALIAFAHLAYLGRDHGQPASAEFGVSVLERARGRGIGARLFERACLQARNRSVSVLQVHALAENLAMLQIARRAGAEVGRSGPDATAILRLPADDWGSHLTQIIEAQAGELDYSFKVQAGRVERLLKAVNDSVRSGEEPPT